MHHLFVNDLAKAVPALDWIFQREQELRSLADVSMIYLENTQQIVWLTLG